VSGRNSYSKKINRCLVGKKGAPIQLGVRARVERRGRPSTINIKTQANERRNRSTRRIFMGKRPVDTNGQDGKPKGARWAASWYPEEMSQTVSCGDKKSGVH